MMLDKSIIGLQAKPATSNVAARVAAIDSGLPDKVSSIIARFEALSANSQRRPLTQIRTSRRPKSDVVARHHLERTSRSRQTDETSVKVEKKPDTMSSISQPDSQLWAPLKGSRRSLTPGVKVYKLEAMPSSNNLMRRSSVLFESGQFMRRASTMTKRTSIHESTPRRRSADCQSIVVSVMDSSDPKLPAPKRKSTVELQNTKRRSTRHDAFTPGPLDSHLVSQNTRTQPEGLDNVDLLTEPRQQPVVERHTVYAQEIIHEKKSSIASLKDIRRSFNGNLTQRSSKRLLSKPLNLVAAAPLHAKTTTSISMEYPIIGQSSNRIHETNAMGESTTAKSTKSIDALRSFYSKPSADKHLPNRKGRVIPSQSSFRTILNKFNFVDTQSNSKDHTEAISITPRVKIALARGQPDTEYPLTLQPEPIKHDNINDLTLPNRTFPLTVFENDGNTTVIQDNKVVRFSNPFLSGDGASSTSNGLVKLATKQQKHRGTPFKISDVTIQHYGGYMNVDHELISPKFHSTVTARSIRLLIDSF